MKFIEIVYEPPFNIERKECGVWDAVDLIDNLEDALLIASSYVELMREENIRIMDKNNRII